MTVVLERVVATRRGGASRVVVRVVDHANDAPRVTQLLEQQRDGADGSWRTLGVVELAPREVRETGFTLLGEISERIDRES